MGILETLGLSTRRLDRLAAPVDLGIVSPWSEGGNLGQIVPAEIFGADIASRLPMSRADAIGIPAVSKARNLLVSTISRFPLVALKPNSTDRVDPQPSFLQRTDGGVGPAERMAWTVDDLIFHGVSLWLVERGALGQVTSAAWCPPSAWTITNGTILVDEQPIDARNVVLFNPPFEGLLNVGNRTLRGARDTEEAWTSRMRNPVPLVELRITDDTNLTQDDANAYVKSWTAKHRSTDDSVGLTPAGMELVDHGTVDPGLFTEGRNAIRTDVGSFLNVRASMLDGTTGIDSLTYTTNAMERNAFYDFDLPFWTTPIEERLSMDDVVPRGQRVRFDKYSEYQIPAPTGRPTED